MSRIQTTVVRPPATTTVVAEDFTISKGIGSTPLFFDLRGRSRVAISLGFNNLLPANPPAVIRVEGRATEQAGWDQLGELVQVDGVGAGAPNKLIHFEGVAVEAIQISYISGGNANTRITKFSARAEGL